MQTSRAVHEIVPQADAQVAMTPRTARLSRRTAFALTGGMLGVLGIGWLADTLATLPLTRAPTGQLSAQAGLYHVTLELGAIAPRAGVPAPAAITILGPDGTALSGLAIEVDANMVEMDMPAPSVRAAQQSGAAWYTCDLLFTMSGTWRLDVRFTPPGGTALTASFTVVAR